MFPEDSSTSDVTASSSDAADTTPVTPADSSPASSSDAPDSTSPSSGDSRQSDREGLLAAVKKVVETTPEPTSLPSEDTDAEPARPDATPQDQAAATGTPGSPATPDAATDRTDADPTEAELKKLRPETRRRFERLLAQRNESRQAFESVQPELQSHRELQGFLRAHQLAPDDVNALLGVGAALRRGDHESFLQGVMPFVLASQEALGYRIGSDLQQQVDDGLIDEQTARELTRTRFRAATAEARLQENQQAVYANQQLQHVDTIRRSVDAWEANIRQQDPDYAHMSDAVRRYAQGLIQERGLPRSPQEAVNLTQAAYDEVRTMLGRTRPAPRPTRPVPSGIHVATSTSGGQPRNMKEAVVMALANARRA